MPGRLPLQSKSATKPRLSMSACWSAHAIQNVCSSIASKVSVSSSSFRLLKYRSQPPKGGTRRQLVHLHGQQIYKREDEHPDQIDEMPVQAANFHMLGAVFAS